jgi:hypothetical protein
VYRTFIWLSILLLPSLLSGCAYRFGLSERSLPGGYTQVAIPVFKNKTPEVGIEPMFTNALIRRFNRSQVARVTDKDASPVLLEGNILKVETRSESAIDRSQLATLPADAVLTTQYRLTVTTEIVLRRKSDEKVIWTGQFTSEKVYAPPRLGTAVVNSANATYNQSARMEYFSRLAEEMMTEAHDRMTENF